MFHAPQIPMCVNDLILFIEMLHWEDSNQPKVKSIQINSVPNFYELLRVFSSFINVSHKEKKTAYENAEFQISPKEAPSSKHD